MSAFEGSVSLRRNRLSSAISNFKHILRKEPEPPTSVTKTFHLILWFTGEFRFTGPHYFQRKLCSYLPSITITYNLQSISLCSSFLYATNGANGSTVSSSCSQQQNLKYYFSLSSHSFAVFPITYLKNYKQLLCDTMYREYSTVSVSLFH